MTPGHTRLRRVLTAAFTPRTVRALQDSMTRTRRPIVAAAARRGEVDAVRDLAPSCPWWSSPTCSACRRRTGT
ncbi:hypothetical protein [Micromonospora sp. b486]|uniref:hypothetical protein n=1 Tax=Micromonospora sp. b486 TaxID=3053986 RepID=UPI00259C7A76|nr:hypothetical protein [Micromonospora sp. b486]MDM4784592.1 hypothetical protein [Micromonospora sp. b486]